MEALSIPIGQKRRCRYRFVPGKALELLRRNPGLGGKRVGLSVDYRLFPAGHHIIVCRSRDFTVSVFRILHERMDIQKHV